MKVLSWRISDRFLAELGRTTLEKWVKNFDVCYIYGHLGAPGRHLILFARRKISDGDQRIPIWMLLFFFYRKNVYNLNHRGLKMEKLFFLALAAPPPPYSLDLALINDLRYATKGIIQKLDK